MEHNFRPHQELLDLIRTYIEENCIFRPDPEVQYSLAVPKGKLVPKSPRSPLSWLMMLRRLTHNPTVLSWVAALIADDIFNNLKTGNEYNSIQLAGLETSSIPLITAIQMIMIKEGIHINSFIVRKERKSYGLFNIVDGIPRDNVPVIVVDDIINSGKSLHTVLDVCTKELNLIPAKKCYCIVAYKHIPLIKYEQHEIEVVPLFSRNQFTYDFDKDKYWLPKDCEKQYNQQVESTGVYNEPSDIVLMGREIPSKGN